ncbi:lycopene cyclase domain-containing protein [Cellulomonas sp. APG4]|uniref:lycopene cyclase domain-containing protein n=1 Tax=Cellulomonas sp. APG4 TaxID=1538656 RepID=UPI00137962F0|nr:lycopene cyclase domain-containing protein [Cellulomonas sp. APG4]NCT92379.1 lycopene cyclase domain-containing protein [Cellulomonas sp. APG4]
MTYALLNLPFLVAALVVLLVARRRTGAPGWRGLGVAAVVLLAMTAVFDNVMIRIGLVAYDDVQRLGPQVGVAPIEDFAYTVLAVLLLPALWSLLGARRRAEVDA